ncbi:MAG: hypothetical protein OXS29_19325 [bacterium]|nr:hypothetical protein [bacterium]MDE0290033.1 hypothetical protein [bacterium]MDE0439544.1 hypothetical protein [bacterium]
MTVKLNRAAGAGLVAYSALYTIQVVFGVLYTDALPASDVYRVMNYFSAAGILVSLAVAWCRKYGCGVAPAGPDLHLVVQTGFYAALALAIWFFTLWFRLLTLADGETVPEPDTVMWFFVSVLIPLVLGTNGAMLWRSGKSS